MYKSYSLTQAVLLIIRLVLHPQDPTRVGRDAFYVICPRDWTDDQITLAVNVVFSSKARRPPVWETVELTKHDLSPKT